MKKVVKKYLLKISPYQPGKPIEEVKREKGLKDVIKLASNENPYGPSPRVLRAIQRAAKTVNRYPDGGCFYLRRTLARRLHVSPDQLVFGNGSDEVIIMALRAFVSEGDEVIVAKPTFMIYAIASKVLGARVRQVPLRDFRYDLEQMARAVTPKTKMIFIGNPDNPAGTYIPIPDLKIFLKRIRKDILIFIDEAYYEYAVRQKDYPDGVSFLKTHKNIIVGRTFSKMYGLAGLRIGYGVADRSVINIMNRVREPFNVNSLAQAAALACLQDRAYYRDITRKIEQQRRYLYRCFSNMRVPYLPTATNFILVQTGKSGAEVARRLLNQGVIVRDMTVWGLDDYIRITIGSPAENRRLIMALRSIRT